MCLTCLIPALFIAGAIAVFVSQAAVIKYFGAGAKKILAYSVASVSGTILAVCSCTVLPLFAGIYMRGGGIGPATSFLYSGPAINVLAIVLTARVLGWKLGLARAIGAVGFAYLIGLAMHFIYLKEEKTRVAGNFFFPMRRTKPALFGKMWFTWPRWSGFLSLPPGENRRSPWVLDGRVGSQMVHHRGFLVLLGPGALFLVPQG